MAAIVGNDGITPVYDPDARWCLWEINEIYTGAVGEKRYVPKVKDYIVDAINRVLYIVDDVDPTTLLTTKHAITWATNPSDFGTDDILFGVGPGTQADTYRAYFDDSVIPHVLAVDQRLSVGGSMTHHAKIFRGADTSSSGQVISRLYDNTGTLLSQDVPLELMQINNTTNHTRKTLQVVNTNESLAEGELITVVLYSDNGHEVSRRQLLVSRSAFVRSLNASQKYITSISLDSPFMSSTLDDTLEFPINIPVSGLGLIGIVNYSDGTSLRMPVDNTKFKIFGLDSYLGTVPGQQVGLVLSYTLGNDETAYGGVTSDGKHVTETYTLKALVANSSYSVKLFGYPVWIDAASGYTMKWYLYTLDRNAVFDVTNLVTFDASTGAFQPKAYGTLQRRSVSLNLRDINGSFKNYVHAQVVDITLLAPATARTTNWTVGVANQNPPYGIDLFAEAFYISTNSWKLRVKSGIANQPAWIDRVYKATKPLYNTLAELEAPIPNMFILRCGVMSIEVPIGNWDNVLTISTSGLVINGTLFIEFIKRVPSTPDLRLGTAAMPIYDATL